MLKTRFVGFGFRLLSRIPGRLPFNIIQHNQKRSKIPTRQGRSLSHYAVGVAISKYAAAAAANCPSSLTANRVTPHTRRHSHAILLRAKGVDIATIALWLGLDA
jgi:site-specific recombinase XerD